MFGWTILDIPIWQNFPSSLATSIFTKRSAVEKLARSFRRIGLSPSVDWL
jgi:hypothetical protein